MKMTKIFSILSQESNTLDKTLKKDNVSLLDVGCGNGDTVHDFLSLGYDAYGTDVEFKEGAHKTDLLQQGRVKKLGTDDATRIDTIDNSREINYLWPFIDASFDLVCSRATLEHVFNIDEFVSENNRVLKSNGIAVHYFPSKFALIEPHVGIPFGGIFRHPLYIYLCLMLGLSFKRYRQQSKAQAIKNIREYLKNYTCYRNQSSIIKAFETHGFVFKGAYADVILKATGKSWAKKMSSFGPLRYLFSLFRSKLLVFEKAEKVGMYAPNLLAQPKQSY